MKRTKSALLEASRGQLAPLEEIDAALTPVTHPDARPAPPVLLPPVEEAPQPESVEPDAAASEPTAALTAVPTPSAAPATPEQAPVTAALASAPRRTRGRGRPTSAQLDEVLASVHLRFPRGMSSWSANLRVPPSLVSELDDWKWRFFSTHQREALNTRILSIALERITAEDLVVRAEQLRAVDPATNIPWAVRIPASMRPLMVELTRATAPALDKSQVGVAALAKFLDDFAALAPQQQG